MLYKQHYNPLISHPVPLSNLGYLGGAALQYDSSALQEYIDNGGAAGDILKIATLDPKGADSALKNLSSNPNYDLAEIAAIQGATVSSALLSAGGTMVGAGGAAAALAAGGTAATSVGIGGSIAAGTATTISGALTAAGISASVPVVGWVIGGVLALGAGGMYLASKQQTKILAKDISIFKDYIKKFSKKYKTSSSLNAKAKEVVKELEKHLKTGSKDNVTLNFFEWGKSNNERGGWNEKKSKLEIQLDALYFIMKERYYGKTLKRAIQKQELVLQREQATRLHQAVRQREYEIVVAAQKREEQKMILAAIGLVSVVTLYILWD